MPRCSNVTEPATDRASSPNRFRHSASVLSGFHECRIVGASAVLAKRLPSEWLLVSVRRHGKALGIRSVAAFAYVPAALAGLRVFGLEGAGVAAVFSASLQLAGQAFAARRWLRARAKPENTLGPEPAAPISPGTEVRHGG